MARGLFTFTPHDDGYTTVMLGDEVVEVAPHVDALVETLRLAAPIARAIESALAEQAAGEAERVREAVAAERKACAAEAEVRGREFASAVASYAAPAFHHTRSLYQTVADELCDAASRIRARATSPAPVAEPAPCICGCPASEHDARNIVGEIERDCAAHGCERYYDSTCTLGEPAPEPVAAERAVVEAAEAWRASLDGSGECWHEARMREAVDALAAARKGGG